MKIRNGLLLFLAATIWGVAFVAQSVGMDHVGPFSFLCARSVIGGLVLLPLIAVMHKTGTPPHLTDEERKQARHMLLRVGAYCGAALFLASALQQIGILYTTVGKSGFLTACYILIVPLLGLFLGRRCGKLVWCGIGLALVGLYLLCMKEGFSLGVGEQLSLGCAVVFSCHILIVDHFSPYVDGVKLSCIQFFVCAALAAIGALLFEAPLAGGHALLDFGFTAPSLSGLLAAWKPVLYAGVLSSGVAYTLQILGQKGMNPTVCSLIMSMESTISVIAGWLLLQQALTGRELFGCVLMFAAIVLAQLPDKKAQIRT